MFSDLLSHNKKTILSFFLLLICLYPISTLVGPFFENLNVIFLGLVSIYYLVKNKDLIKANNLPLILFFLIIFFNSLNSESSDNIIKSLKYIFYLSILLFCCTVKFEKSIFQLFQKVFIFIVITLFILIIDMIIQKIFGYNLLGYKSLACYYDSIKITNCRASGFFGDEYVAGSFISRILVIVSIYYLLIEKRFTILIPFLIFSFIAIYFSGERMALGFSLQILLIIIIYLLILEKKKLNPIKWIMIFFIITITFLLTLSQNTSIRFSKGIKLLYNKDYFKINISTNQLIDIEDFKFKEKYQEKEFELIPNEIYGYYLNDGKIKEFTPRNINNLNFVPTFLSKTKFRINNETMDKKNSVFQIISTQKVHQHFFNSTGWSAHFIAALKIFEKNYFLGTGLKSFHKECSQLDTINHIYDKHKCSIHPHNYHLEILQSSGVLGYISFLILIYCLFMIIIKNKNISLIDKFLIIAILFVIYHPITTSGSIFSSAFSNKLWFISSITILLSRLKAYKNEFNF
tara:strand:- start:598 stop:2148 length:1551 start_codon:yes stop_codon:yes gene_type:complete